AFNALLMMTCGSTKIEQTTTLGTKSESTTTSKSEETGFANAERVGEMMNYLASNDLKGRDSGSEGIEMAAKYIENHFKSYGVKPYFETYRDTLSNFKAPSYNIVGVVEGNDPALKGEYIVIG